MGREIEIMFFENSDQLNRYMVDERHIQRVMISFSCGKDSIGCWINMRRFYPEIIPFYLYLIPDLEFVEESLNYYESVFGCHIIRLPHPSLYRWMRNLVFCDPPVAELYNRLNPVSFDYEDIRKLVWDAAGDDGDGYYGLGVRAADNINRWGSIKRFGPINQKQHKFYPIFDWNKQKLMDEIKGAGIKLPVDYRMFGRSFDGIDYRFLVQIKKYYPRDYDRILELFPLADMEIYRREKWANEKAKVI